MLSNTEQSAISAFSILLIGLGAVASRVTSPLLAIGLIIAGAIGLDTGKGGMEMLACSLYQCIVGSSDKQLEMAIND